MEELADIQLTIADVTLDTIGRVKQSIESAKVFNGDEGESLLLDNFLSLVPIRFHNLDVITSLFSELLETFKTLKNKLEESVFSVPNDDGLFLQKRNQLFFMKSAFKHGIFPTSYIIEKIEQMPDSHPQVKTYVAFFFIEEIANEKPEFFERMINIRKKAECAYFFGQYMQEIPSFQDMKSNSFKDLHTLLEKGYLDPTLLSIKNDDDNEFVAISAQPWFSKDRRVKQSIFDPIYFPEEDASLFDFCASCGSIKVFKIMLLSTYEVDENLFEFSVCSCNYEMVHILEQQGKATKKCLAAAAVFRPLDIFEWLIRSFYSDIFSFDGKGRLSDNSMKELSYTFAAAIDMNSFFCADFCVSHGVDVNSSENKDDMHPLFLALKHPSMLKYLLSLEGINKNPTAYDATPFLRAVQLGNEPAFDILFSTEGIDIEFKNNSGMNSFMFAAQNGHFNILKKLFESKRFNVNDTDMHGETALHKACIEGRSQVVEFLINQSEVNPSIKTNMDYTCLHVACMNNRVDVVRILVGSGRVNTKEPGFRNMTPEQLTTNDEIKKILSSK